MFRHVTPANLDAVRTFLEANLETSVFLLACLSQFGPTLGENPNSGTFRCWEEDERVVAVMSLTRRGHLLAQTGGRPDLGAHILHACANDPVRVAGIVAEWQAAESIWHPLVAAGSFHPAYVAKNIVYDLPLPEPPRVSECEALVRPLAPDDFEQWDAHNTAFLREEGAPLLSGEERRRANFLRRSLAGHWWGAFKDIDLVATAALDESYGTTAQIGGIYTRPEERRKGFARVLLQALLRDLWDRLEVRRVVLFAHESNTAARTFYESIGFAPKGFFGMVFSAHDEDELPPPERARVPAPSPSARAHL